MGTSSVLSRDAILLSPETRAESGYSYNLHLSPAGALRNGVLILNVDWSAVSE